MSKTPPLPRVTRKTPKKSVEQLVGGRALPGPSIAKLDPALIDKAVARAKLGCSDATLAAILGITPQSFYAWMRYAENPGEHVLHGELYCQLADRIKVARAENETQLTAVLFAAAVGRQPIPKPGTPEAEKEACLTKPKPSIAQWMLEHGPHRQHWMTATRHQVSLENAGGAAIQIMLPKLEGDETPDGRDSC